MPALLLALGTLDLHVRLGDARLVGGRVGVRAGVRVSSLRFRIRDRVRDRVDGEGEGEGEGEGQGEGSGRASSETRLPRSTSLCSCSWLEGGVRVTGEG